MTDAARDLALQALVVKHVADTAARTIRDRRADLADALRNGDRVGVRSPDYPDLDLGLVWRTKPSATAVVTDRSAFTTWMARHYPDRVAVSEQVMEGCWDEAVAVLREHAPHLLTTHTLVARWAEREVETLTVAARQPCGPGRELDVPGVAYEPPGCGVVTVKLSEDGPGEIERLWRAGRIELGSGAVRELEGGERGE